MDVPTTAELSRWISEASEEEIRAALDEIIGHFPDYLDAERTAGVDAVFGLDLRGRDGIGHRRYAVTLEGGSCRVTGDPPRDSDVTLEVDAVDFVKLVAGRVNPAVLALDGRLEIRGNERLAIALTGYFRAPVPGVGLIDPRAVDAVEIARVIERVPEAVLRKRIRGGIRDLVLEEVFRRIPSYISAERSRDVQAVIDWRITGREDGGTDRYVVVIDRGMCRTAKEIDAPARVSLRLDPAHLLKLVTGNTSTTLGFLFGKVKVKGDLVFAARLTSLFDIPTAG